MLFDDEIAELRTIFADVLAEREQRRAAYLFGAAHPSLVTDLRQLDACTRAASERIATGDEADGAALLELTTDKAIQIKHRLHRGAEHAAFA
ncbi:hypothetical protein [Azospirillum agricola]|uniref:hypothetical protein n=1 Tax=Azospirillum agricola TaxID=1720247 RepID=UPI000A0F0143|nr:hypothetical protein [Azospirillum agricola]SMH32077.1 hypothetical protein SAMN02982994_0548 [Azospirillum lipoferum]